MTNVAEATAAAGLTILAPAKLNLSLAVLARREDGFHEIESLMVPVNWLPAPALCLPATCRPTAETW